MLPDLSVLTPRDAIELLERAVAEKGDDYVYRPDRTAADWCYYADYADYEVEERVPTGPGCIVGHVLYYLGATPEDLAALDLQMLPSATTVGENLHANAEVIGILKAAQDIQDNLPHIARYNTWGHALAVAKEKA